MATLAAARHGLGVQVELLRSGANHVFRAGDAVIRVAAGSADVAGQVRLARRLVAEGFPVPAPLADAETVDGVPVSLWEYVAGAGRTIDYEQLGAIIARLHAVAPSELGALPFFGDAAWLAVDRRLAQTGTELPALVRACDALRGWQERARAAPLVVCHGDVHPRNVLMRGDDVVIVDWDSLCLAPAAFDHAALLPWADRYGGDPAAYPDFARGYGADLRGSPPAEELATLRLLAATLNIVADQRFTAEARARLRYWEGDPAAPLWNAL
ncbi:phosphotransferase enzyme family protein [Solirubrobacter ginsenosidimutans]|uniref:phosphotransferase enzyme family protein n=1 Tax=Solirubrobacter ginsenosidimutans TaxID=490573 RepID=UPI0022CDCC28|nr:phosphotransferase [Solirubrobacter ginsenosidimutans]